MSSEFQSPTSNKPEAAHPTQEQTDLPTSEMISPIAEVVTLATLRDRSGVKFGTSGARGLVTALTDLVAYSYCSGFVLHLIESGQMKAGTPMVIGGDLRPSTPRIMQAAIEACREWGSEPILAGTVSSPALAHYAMQQKFPSIMITGSHIPDDRNGIKFTTPTGEITKADEEGILSQRVPIMRGLFDEAGMFRNEVAPLASTQAAWDSYEKRYLDFFPENFLSGLKIGVYQHSAVAREFMPKLLSALGAEVVPLGWSDTFVPVDTEAIRAEDFALAKDWAASHKLDAIVSADGDSDRPLTSDEHGNWLRGDVAALLVAKYLGASSIAAPVSCTTALERCGFFENVIRTKIGSPFVIAGMEQALFQRERLVVGFEANGGFLLASPVQKFGKTLDPLPTRDAAIVHLSVLGLARETGKTISELVADLPQRFTHSDRLQEFPTEKAQTILHSFSGGDWANQKTTIEACFGKVAGNLVSVDTTDGVRMTFQDDIIHLRPSGNAPEFRVYTESPSEARAAELNASCMQIVREL